MSRRPAHPSEEDRRRLRAAVELSRSCPPSAAAFSVGAVITDTSGDVIATGYSREHDPHDHAEETALGKVGSADSRLRAATIYSSLEPCSTRKSRPRSCTALILAARIPRVVFAWREPTVFVDGHGAGTLRDAGIEVIEIPDLADLVREVNAHLLRADPE